MMELYGPFGLVFMVGLYCLTVEGLYFAMKKLGCDKDWA